MCKISREEREKKIIANLGLVKYLAHTYKIDGNALDIYDLIQEGTLGLMKAVDSHDVTRGSFAAYAVILITQYFIRALRANEGIFSLGNIMYRLMRMSKNYILLYAKEPSYHEFKKMAESVGVTYHNALIVYTACVSSAKNKGRDNDEIEQITGGVYPYQYDTAEKNSKMRLLIKLLRKCNRDERLVIAKYYGFGGKKGRTLKEIAKEMDVGISRVSNIKREGERRLQQLLMQYTEGSKWHGRLRSGMKKIKGNS